MLIFDASPKTLYKNIVDSPAFAIHADPNLVGLQQAGELGTRELTTLIGIEDLRGAIALNSILGHLSAPFGRHGVADAPIDHKTALKVYDRTQAHISSPHGNGGNIHCPYLIYPVKRQDLEQIRILVVPRVRNRRSRAAVDRLPAPNLHESPDPFSVDLIPGSNQPGAQPSDAEERSTQVLFVHEAQDGQILLALGARLIIEATAM